MMTHHPLPAAPSHSSAITPTAPPCHRTTAPFPALPMQAVHPHGDTTIMAISGLALLLAAFFPPLLRTVSFVGIGSVMVAHYSYLVNVNLGCQLAMYVAGAVTFVRGGGHKRWQGCSDHHMLHYLVTLACCLHVQYIRTALVELQG
jgi:hypothetical protein